MNFYNFNPLELATKTALLQNGRVRDFISNMSKVRTMVQVIQLCNQIDNYRRIALFTSCYCSDEERREIHERCSHGIYDCNNELRKLTEDAIRDELVIRELDKNRCLYY